MEIILTTVVSANGKITDTHDRAPHAWASKEDQEFFQKLARSCGVVIMGTATYTAQKKKLGLTPQILRIVMTRTPQKYTADSVPGQLEFTDLPPRELVRTLRPRFKSLLLASGPRLTSIFLREKLVTQLWLTIEPRLFARGRTMGNALRDTKLLLRKAEKLNRAGTFVLKYRIQK